MEIFLLIKKKIKFCMYRQNSLTTDPQAFQGIMSSSILRGVLKPLKSLHWVEIEPTISSSYETECISSAS